MRSKNTVIAQNRKASFDFFIEDRYESGLLLKGTEIKSMRNGNVNIVEAHVEVIAGELFITNMYIPEYTEAHKFNHYPYRSRKLLLHKREINKIIGFINRKGYTVIATKAYFNEKNIAKIELGLAKGKKQYDKREVIKKRDQERENRREHKNMCNDKE